MAELKWSNGMFVWRELMTDDVEGARRFYSELFGWTFKGENMGPSRTYWLATRDGVQVGGTMAKPAGMKMPSNWSSYVLVDGVDAAVERCKAAGGRVFRPPEDIPNVGRFAVTSDAWGAVLQPFRSFGEEPASPPRPGVGRFCWETLVTPDPKAATAFYTQVFGFGTAPSPSGEGTVFTSGGAPVADIQKALPGAPSHWETYVRVENLEASRDRALRLGGKVLVSRIDVPKVGFVSMISDPAGAALGLFQPSM